jgi:hypothetical protein
MIVTLLFTASASAAIGACLYAVSKSLKHFGSFDDSKLFGIFCETKPEPEPEPDSLLPRMAPKPPERLTPIYSAPSMAGYPEHIRDLFEKNRRNLELAGFMVIEESGFSKNIFRKKDISA